MRWDESNLFCHDLTTKPQPEIGKILVTGATGDTKEETLDPNGLEFQHPYDIDEMWKEVGCSECHTGENQ